MTKTFLKLTRSQMRKLESGGRITERGITFERIADGDGLFSVNIMVDRRRIHRSIGRESDGTTRSTAEEFIAKVRHDARVGRLNLPKRRKVALTLATAAPLYIDRLHQEGGKNIERKRLQLEQSLIPYFSNQSLAQITTFDIERYKKSRTNQPIRSRKKLKAGETYPLLKPSTINRELATLSHLLNKAAEWGWIERPAAKIRKLKEGTGRIVYLTAEQADALLEASKGDQNRQIYPFILTGLRTGMRKSEILTIRREHVDLAAHSIYVPHAKAGARVQPISPDLADFLSGYIETLPLGTPWLFPSVGSRHGHTVDVRKAFVRSVIAAGLDPKQVVPHTLRHTAITHLVQAGVDLPTVKRISGHKTLAMVERYAHQSGAHIVSALEKLDARYREDKKPVIAGKR
jgi:integrase